MSTIVVVVLPTFLKILVLDSHCDIVGRYHLCVIFFLIIFKFDFRSSLIIRSQGTVPACSKIVQ